MNANKRLRLIKKFRRLGYMAGAGILFMLASFIPVASISGVCGGISGLLFFCALIYFLIMAADERSISNTSEGIKDSK